MAYRSSSVASGQDAAPTGSAPAGTVAGDRLLAYLSVDLSTATATPATDWTEIGNVQLTLDGHRKILFEKKVATGSDSYVFGLSVSYHSWNLTIVALSGRDATAAATVVSTSNNTSQNTPISISLDGVTAALNDDLLTFTTIDKLGGNDVWAYSQSTNFTERQESNTTWCSTQTQSRDAVAAGATGAIAITATRTSGTANAGWGGFVVAIPAVAASGASYVAPTYQNAGTFTNNIAAFTAPLPASTVQNDFLLLLVETTNQAITTPADWTQVANSPQFTGTAAAIGGVRLGVFYQFAPVSPVGASIDDSGNLQTAQIFRFTGVDQTAPINVTAGSVLATAGTAWTLPAVTTTRENCLVALCVGNDRDLASTANLSAWTNGNLSSLTEIGDATSVTALGGGIGLAVGLKATAGDTGTTAVTNAASNTAAFITIALNGIQNIALEGDANAVAAGTGNLEVGITPTNIDGATVSQTTATGAVGINKAVTGSAANTTTDTGAVGINKAIAGGAAGAATDAGTVDVSKTITGSVAGVSTDTGSIGIAKALAGDAAASATDAGTLSNTTEVGSLSGAASGVSTDTGVIGISKTVAGGVANVTTATGSVTIAKTIDASAAAIASDAGVVQVQVPIVGATMLAQATVTGAVGVSQTLAGAAAGVTTDAGVSQSSLGLGGAANSVATDTGTVSTAAMASIAGAAQGQTTDAGTLNINTVATGDAAGVTTDAGTISITKSLTGDAVASTTLGGINQSAAASVSFWATPAPANTTEADPSAGALGLEFWAGVAGNVTGVKFYKGSNASVNGGHVGELWNKTTGVRVASVSLNGTTPNAWNSVNFSTPVAIAANARYVIAVWAPGGQGYPHTGNYFAGQYDAGVLHAAAFNGLYYYGANGSGIPNSSHNNTNYWVDVVFQEASAGVTTVAGNAVGVTTDTGAVAITEPVSGTAANVSTNTGNIKITESIAGDTQSVGSDAGTISITKSVAGNVQSVAGDSGLLTITEVGSLTGNAQNVATDTGSLSIAKSLAGSAAGLATATGLLTSKLNLTGASASVSIVAGVASVNLSIAGNDIAQALATGATSLSIALSGSALSSALASAQITLAAADALSGSASSNTTAAGLLKISQSAGGSANAATSLSGSLFELKQIEALASARASTTGAILAQLNVGGISQSVASVTGNLVLEIPIIDLLGDTLSETLVDGYVDVVVRLSGAALASALATALTYGNIAPATRKRLIINIGKKELTLNVLKTLTINVPKMALTINYR